MGHFPPRWASRPSSPHPTCWLLKEGAPYTMSKDASPQLSAACPGRPDQGPVTAGRVCAVRWASAGRNPSPL